MPTLESVVRCDPDVLGGTPVFAGTRVGPGLPRRRRRICWTTSPPASLERFIDHFPSVTRKQAVAALELSKDLLTSRATPAR